MTHSMHVYVALACNVVIFFICGVSPSVQVMQEHAAVFRDGPTLKAGCEKITALWKDLSNLKVCLFAVRIFVLCRARDNVSG